MSATLPERLKALGDSVIGRTIYWRFTGNKVWNESVVRSVPADGLVDLRENQYSMGKNIVSIDEIEWKFARPTACATKGDGNG